MNELKFQYKKKPFTVLLPESWNELRADQLLFIASRWATWRRFGEIATRDALKEVFELLLVLGDIDPKKWWTKKHRAFFSLIPSRLDVLMWEQTDLFYKRYSYLPEVRSLTDFVLLEPVQLTKNRFPVVQTANFKLRGPNDFLVGISIDEFVFADTFFIKWLISESVDDLDQLVSILYRPEVKKDVLSPSYNGDMRADFNKNAVDVWFGDVKKMDVATKTAIALFYQGCRGHWEKVHPAVFDAAEDEGGGEQGWFTVLSELPADKFGNMEQRGRMSADLMFMELARIINKHKPS